MVATSHQTQSGAGAGFASTNKASKRVGPIARKSLAVKVLKDRGSDRPQRAYDELTSARPNCLDQFSVDDDGQFKPGMFRAPRGAKVSWATRDLEETRELVVASLAVVTDFIYAVGFPVVTDLTCAAGFPVVTDLTYTVGRLRRP